MTGGRDHLTHRLLLAVETPGRVAVILAVSQAWLCAMALVGYELGTAVLAGLALLSFLTGVGVVLVLDSARWRPGGIAVGALERPSLTEPLAASVGDPLPVTPVSSDPV